MEPYDQLNQPQQPAKRPVFLTVLGVMSFINLGFSGLMALLSYVTGPASEESVENYIAMNMRNVDTIREADMNGLADAMEKMVRFIHFSNDNHYLLTSMNLLVAVLGIIGVIYMFNGRRLGFHIYIISCIVKITSFYTYAPVADVPSVLVVYFFITSILFIFLYSRNLKWMK